ncbi:hypothetical protein Pelo_12615 [Pelomyxa schiedti]|nr:hypothetical protein Pelo_12615 [Pelomyxa schiedti]
MSERGRGSWQPRPRGSPVARGGSWSPRGAGSHARGRGGRGGASPARGGAWSPRGATPRGRGRGGFGSPRGGAWGSPRGGAGGGGGGSRSFSSSGYEEEYVSNEGGGATRNTAATTTTTTAAANARAAHDWDATRLAGSKRPPSRVPAQETEGSGLAAAKRLKPSSSASSGDSADSANPAAVARTRGNAKKPRPAKQEERIKILPEEDTIAKSKPPKPIVTASVLKGLEEAMEGFEDDGLEGQSGGPDDKEAEEEEDIEPISKALGKPPVMLSRIPFIKPNMSDGDYIAIGNWQFILPYTRTCWFKATEEASIPRLFSNAFGFSADDWSVELAKNGSVLVNDKPRELSDNVRKGDVVSYSVHFHEVPVSADKPILVKETNSFWMIDKPACVGANSTISFVFNSLDFLFKKMLKIESDPIYDVFCEPKFSGISLIAKTLEARDVMREHLSSFSFVVIARVVGSFPPRTFAMHGTPKTGFQFCKESDPDASVITLIEESTKSHTSLVRLQCQGPYFLERFQYAGYPVANAAEYGGSKDFTYKKDPHDIKVLEEVCDEYFAHLGEMEKLEPARCEYCRTRTLPSLPPMPLMIHVTSCILEGVFSCKSVMDLPYWARHKSKKPHRH